MNLPILQKISSQILSKDIDEIEMRYENKIPLWLFGFLY